MKDYIYRIRENLEKDEEKLKKELLKENIIDNNDEFGGDKEAIVDEEKSLNLKIAQLDEKQYTQLIDVVPSVKTVKILKNLASGINSEFTAIATYNYQFIIEADKSQEIADRLEEISLVEMRHYELLGKAIVLFGGDPTLTNGQGQVWSGRFVDYERNPKKFLNNNIKAERGAIIEYERAVKMVQNESLKNLFLEIIDDETRHIEIFEGLLQSIK